MRMLGEKISAEQAADWGLIHKAVDDDALLDEARALAKRLANGPTVSLGTMRKILRTGLSQSYSDTLDAEAMGQYVAGNSGDAMEGIRSEEHTSELQSLMRSSYAVFCLKKTKKTNK